jgi:quercetin dioxygenase-like cupin family protein
MNDQEARGPGREPVVNRELQAPVKVFEPSREIQMLKEETAYREHGRNGLTIIHEPSLRVVLTAMAAGREIVEQAAAGPLLLQVIEGAFTFRAGEASHRLYVGNVLGLEQGVSYAVEALEDGAFLHILVWQQ